jgi:hypothetical protein
VIVLGPCPCSACGRLLVWDGWEWKNFDGTQPGTDHDCRARARANGYNTTVGSSDESKRITNDARVSATTGGAGVVSSIEVVAR